MPVTGSECDFDLNWIRFEMIDFLRQGELMMNWGVSQPEERCCFAVWWYSTVLQGPNNVSAGQQGTGEEGQQCGATGPSVTVPEETRQWCLYSFVHRGQL